MIYKKNIRWKKINNYYIGKKKRRQVGFELKTLRSVADVWTYSATLINIKITKEIRVIVFNQLSLILLTIFRKEVYATLRRCEDSQYCTSTIVHIALWCKLEFLHFCLKYIDFPYISLQKSRTAHFCVNRWEGHK